MNKIYTVRNNLLIALGVVFGSMLSFAPQMTASAVSEADGDTNGIAISPTNQRFAIDAGSQQSGKLTILNTGTTDINYIIYARPYSVTSGDYSTPSYNPGPGNSDAYKWVALEMTQGSLAAGKSTEVSYNLRVPVGAAPGGHYGVVFVETKAPAGNGQSIVRNKRLGAILQVNVKGNYRISGLFKNQVINGYQPRTPLSVTSRVENTGNTDFDTTQKLTVMDTFGHVKYQYESKFIVYPDTARDMTLKWNDSPWFGLFKVKVATSFLDQNYAKESFVLVAPRWMLVVMAVVIVGGAIYAFRRRR